jgi:hypothetical protein
MDLTTFVLLRQLGGDSFPDNLSRGLPSDIGRAKFGRGQHILDRSFNCVRCFTFAKMAEHHRAGPDLPDGIGDSLSGNVRGRTMDWLASQSYSPNSTARGSER